MSPPPDIETSLRAQRWREPSPAFLQHVLELALEESRQRPGAGAQRRQTATGCPKGERSESMRRPSGAFERPQAPAKRQRTGALQDAHAPDARTSDRRPWPLGPLAFIPRPLRLPLAACWLLAFFFRITTPEAVPQATLDHLAKLPAPPTPAQLLARLEQAERLAHELLEHLRGPVPPL